MNDTLYPEQLRLEEEARGLTIRRFEKEHEKAEENNAFAETFIGSHLIGHYLVPFSNGLGEWLKASNTGKAGRKSVAAKYLVDIDTHTVAFLFLKALFNKVGVYRRQKPCTFTALAIHSATLIHDEIRLRHFEDEHPILSKRVHKDFASRELPREKREEYMRTMFDKQEMEWSTWTTSNRVHVGSALIEIFQKVSGDITLETMGSGKGKRLIVSASPELLKVIESTDNNCSALLTAYQPCVIPPVDWSPENLTYGGYFSENITPYPFVKGSKPAYKKLLKQLADEGKLDRTFDAVNALQRTPWKINKTVLEVMRFVYDNNIPCGKLPLSDPIVMDDYPNELVGKTREEVMAYPDEHPIRTTWSTYMAYRAKIHEANRRIVGKRVMAQRAFQLAEQFSQYEAIYFPHDMDSRGRLYPKPAGLNPQGADYVKGLLQFAKGKALGKAGVYWLGVHGANCYGEDKLPIHERASWAQSHTNVARSVASDPWNTTEIWTKTDNPAQYLAWCLEWAAAHDLSNPEDFVSHIHVDLDATCSGLQHFSAMLKDKVGGFHVNMTENDVRQDVYGAVATIAEQLIRNDLGTDMGQMAQAWLDFGIDRKLTKRSVMVKPYSGTRTSCNTYVAEAVTDRINGGEPLPWPQDDLWTFMMYGAGKVWDAIPQVVVAADGAMQWLSTIARLVGKSQPDLKRIEWTTPMGLPVWQYKFNMKSRQIETLFDGKRLRPRITEETDKLDSRQMGSSVAPSFVHSLDACHLMATISAAYVQGMEYFAAVHDSFGVHAADIEQFTQIIREEFVWMYNDNDVLNNFLEGVEPLISEKFLKDIPPVPSTGDLDLQGILTNQFFFS